MADKIPAEEIGVVPGLNQETDTIPVINDITQEQIEEMGTGNSDGVVVGYDDLTTVDVNLETPSFPEETVYRKRAVKVVNGKIVAQRIVYMRRVAISASGGSGDVYTFLQPVGDNQNIAFQPVDVTFN